MTLDLLTWKPPRQAPPSDGQRYGRLLCLGRSDRKTNNGAYYYRFLCDCGNKRDIVPGNIKRGQQSCGCLMRERIAKRNTTHGCYETPERKIWDNMLQRCRNPRHKSYVYYGGRGITVCERWANLTNFFADMGQRPSKAHSLDRINNDGNYEPGNCRWATRLQQERNKSTTRFVTAFGRTQCVAEWSEELRISERAIWYRLNAGWLPERALTQPPRRVL